MGVQMRDPNTTLRKWFNDFTKETGEKVQWVQLYEYGTELQEMLEFREEKPSWLIAKPGTTWAYHETPKAILDFSFYPGYGSADAPKVIAWSDSFVINIHEYDGAEWLEWFPRNPQEA
jgi:hypothetical protein